jgi:hypothetical protein
MYYPNTNQISALTGRTIKPDYASYISEQVSALPQYLQLEENRDYNNAQLDLQERSLAETTRQNAMNYDLAKDQADSAKKHQLYGNLISGAGLGLNAYQALDEAGVDIAGGASRALNSVLPESSSSLDEIAPTLTEFGESAEARAFHNGAGNIGGGTLEQFARGVSDWVVEPAQTFGENAATFVTKDLPELYDVGKKIISGDGGWSDVSGWVDNLFK